MLINRWSPRLYRVIRIIWMGECGTFGCCLGVQTLNRWELTPVESRRVCHLLFSYIWHRGHSRRPIRGDPCPLPPTVKSLAPHLPEVCWIKKSTDPQPACVANVVKFLFFNCSLSTMHSSVHAGTHTVSGECRDVYILGTGHPLLLSPHHVKLESFHSTTSVLFPPVTHKLLLPRRGKNHRKKKHPGRVNYSHKAIIQDLLL